MAERRRRYSKAEEAAAVGLAIATGQRAASEATGVPLTTLHQWYHRPEYEQLRTTARSEVAEAMWAAAQLGVAAMVDALDNPKVSLRDKTDATSMLTEKYLLLTGQATSRSESRSLTDELDDDERSRLRDWILSLPATADAAGSPSR